MYLNYVVKGKGEPLVLLHGLFGSLENLGVIARQLQEEYQVISIDLPDHGQSPHSAQFSFAGYAELVVNTLKQLGLESVSLLGHSLGGKIAMEIALNHPEMVNNLLVADIAPVSYKPRHQNVFAALKAVDLKNIATRQQADQAMSEFLSEAGVRQFLLKSLVKDEQGRFAWRFNLDMLIRDYDVLSAGIESNSQYRSRVLFIKGANSDYITREHQEHITRLFPNAEAKIIANTGHWLHAEKPFVFAGIVSSFLEGND